MGKLKQQFCENEAKFPEDIYTPYCLRCCDEAMKILFWDHLCNKRYALLSNSKLFTCRRTSNIYHAKRDSLTHCSSDFVYYILCLAGVVILREAQGQ